LRRAGQLGAASTGRFRLPAEDRLDGSRTGTG